MRKLTSFTIVIIYIMSILCSVNIVFASEDSVEQYYVGTDNYLYCRGTFDDELLLPKKVIDYDVDEAQSIISVLVEENNEYIRYESDLSNIEFKPVDERSVSESIENDENGIMLFSASDNEAKIYSFLINDMKLNQAAASGVLANLYCENASFEPNRRQGGGTGFGTYNDSVGYGICQWTYWSRKKNLQDWCNKNVGNGSWSTLNGQLKFMKYELEKSSTALKKIKGVANTKAGAYDAGYYFCFYYEKPAYYDKTYKKNGKTYKSESDYRGILAQDKYWAKYEKDATPAAPTIKTCKATSDSAVKITWSEVSGAEYKIERTENNDANKKTIKGIKDTSYTDTGLKSGTTYYYTVYAVRGSQTSKASDYYKTYTKPKAPDKPEVSQDSTSQLTISWNKVSGASKYQVIYHKAGSSEWKTLADNIDGTSYTHKDLAVGQKYYYRVIAKRIGNIGPKGKTAQEVVSSAQSETKTKFTKIKEPSHSPNDANNAYVDLSWAAVKGDSTYTYVYKVFRDGKEISSYLTGTSYTDKTASSDKIHQYQVKVYEKGTDYTLRTSCVPFYAGAKLSPAITATPESTKTIKLSWQTPKSAPTGVKYEVRRKLPNDADYVTIKTTTATSYTDTNLTAGTTYQYYVRVTDSTGNYITRITGKTVKLDIVPSKVALNKTALTLTEGETATLSATITPSNSFDKSITWTTSNANIATVNSSGLVTAKKAGTVDITVKTSNGMTAKCTITVQSAACTHSYGEWIIDVNETCETDGSKHRVCSKCGEIEEETILATGHSYPDEMQIIQNPTCSEQGEEAYVCTTCGNQKDNTVIEMIPHTFGEWEQETITSCTSEGIEIRTCEVCSETETRTTEPKDHTYKLVAQTDPTLDAPGKRTYICEVCQDSYEEEWVNVVSEGIVSVGGAAPDVGKTVTIPVKIMENPGIAGFTFTVNYDKSVLTPKEITRGELITGGNFTSNLEQGIPVSELDEVIVHWNTDSNVTDDGTLFNVVFDVSSTAAEGQYAIWLEYENGDITNQNLDDVMPTVLANAITIADVLRGDVNLDRIVDQRDAVLLSRYIGGWKLDFTDKQKQAANVYGDSEINSKDGVRLSQLLVGYEDITDSTEAISLMSTSNTKLTVESAEALAGDTIYVPVSISDNTGIAGFDFKLNYDSTYLTPISIESGDVLASGDFSTSLDEDAEITDGTITASWSNAINMTEDGTLFVVEFLVSDSVEVDQTLTVTLDDEYVICNQSLDDVNITHESSNIDIIPLLDDGVNVMSGEYYNIGEVTLLQNELIVEQIPQNGNFDMKIDIESTQEDSVDGEIIISMYDDEGRFIKLQSVEMTDDILLNGYCTTHIEETENSIASIKLFVWDSLSSIKPLSRAVVIE